MSKRPHKVVATAPVTTYRGSCHCGNISFEVTAHIERLLECNCSYCRRRGSMTFLVERQQLRLLTAPSKLAIYTFHNHVIQHHFCPQCGLSPYGVGSDGHGVAMALVNARCLEDMDLSRVEIVPVDGSSF